MFGTHALDSYLFESSSTRESSEATYLGQIPYVPFLESPPFIDYDRDAVPGFSRGFLVLNSKIEFGSYISPASLLFNDAAFSHSITLYLYMCSDALRRRLKPKQGISIANCKITVGKHAFERLLNCSRMFLQRLTVRLNATTSEQMRPINSRISGRAAICALCATTPTSV